MTDMESSPAQIIKEKLDVAEVIKAYVTLQPAGKSFKGLCPFHREKTPSFIVSPDRQSWHCFGCGQGGDIFSFVMKHENLEFGEALKILAEKAGVELRRMSPLEYKQFGLLYDLNAAAKEFFIAELARSETAKTYLHERKLTKTTLDEFEVGWAPPDGDALTVFLINKGYELPDIIRAGLSLKSERGLAFDRFRGRVMFPIWNHVGKVVGFTGRILPQFDRGDVGKYVNSPETPIFVKSKILYGFSRAKNAIRETGEAFLVEGQMDALMAWQAGIRNVVATSGTALTADHLHALRRLTDRLALGLDSDEAGLAALERAIDLSEALDFAIRVVRTDPHKDAADVVAADPGLLQKMIAGAIPAMEFYFQRYLPPDRGDTKDREYVKKLRTILGKLQSIASPVVRSGWMRELAKRTGISEEALQEESARITPAEDIARDRKDEAHSASASEAQRTKREQLSDRLLALAFSRGDFTLVEGVTAYFPDPHQKAFELLRGGANSANDPVMDGLINGITFLATQVAESELEEMKRHLEREFLRERRLELSEFVRRAELAGDEDALRAALEEISRLPAA